MQECELAKPLGEIWGGPASPGDLRELEKLPPYPEMLILSGTLGRFG